MNFYGTKIILFMTIIFFITCACFSQTEKFSDENLDGYIHRGIKATIMQKYENAISTFDSLKLHTQGDPRPYFYQAAAVQAKMMDLENYQNEDLFFTLIDDAIQYAEDWISDDKLKVMGYYYKGASLTYRCFFHSHRKDYLKGLKDAMVGIQFLEKTVSRDSTYYDAYLGIGSYKYWRSRLTQYFAWLPFFPDQRAEGIKMIKKSIQYGYFGKDVAFHSLIWLEIDRGNYDRAIKMAFEIGEKYPGSRYFIWPLAESYYHAGQFDKAVIEYQKLMDSYRLEEENNHYNEIICGHKIAQIWLLQKKYDSTCELAGNLLVVPLEKVIKKRLNEKLGELKKIMKDCAGLNNQ